MTIAVCTLINLLANLLLYFILLGMYRQHESLGWQKIRFRVRTYRLHRRRRNIYIMDIYFRGSEYMRTISKEEYIELSRNQEGSIMAYVREFRKIYLNPDFEKYEFSLQEIDWNQKDRSKCLKSLIASFMVFEFLICIMIFQV